MFAALLYTVYVVSAFLLVSAHRKANQTPAFATVDSPWDVVSDDELMVFPSPVEANFNAIMELANEVAEDTTTEATDNSSDLEYRISQYEAHSLAGLRDIAKQRGMTGYSALRKAALAERLAEDDLG